MKPILVYLSGPITAAYGSSIKENAERAAAIYFDCIRHGLPALCPHLGAVFPQAFDIDYETWMAYDFAVIDRCTHMLMLPRWETSSGAVREQAYAFLKGLPTFYALEDLIAHLAQKESHVDLG